VILTWDLGGNGGQRHLLWPGVLSGGGEPGFREDVEADVAAHLGPFVVLLGQDGADEADEGVAAGEDPDDVGAALEFLVQPFLYPAFGDGGKRVGVAA
jgi:hypothetical protein